jgi:hypothetical protein
MEGNVAGWWTEEEDKEGEEEEELAGKGMVKAKAIRRAKEGRNFFKKSWGVMGKCRTPLGITVGESNDSTGSPAAEWRFRRTAWKKRSRRPGIVKTPRS